MNRIKSFSKYVFESQDPMTEDARVANLFQEIDRNYNNYPSLSSMKMQEILIYEERRDWKNFQEIVELENVKSEPCKFYLRFEMGADEYEVQIDFSISFKGVKNIDLPEPEHGLNDDGTQRVGTSLESISLKKIQVKSSSLKFNSSKFSKDLGKTVLRFLLNVFKPQFDMIGDESLIIRQL